MSTISNERLEKLSEYDCADRYEVMSMATELLALRKEREMAEPVVTDDMALAFHHAFTDGAIGSDEVEEIKTGLRAALANYAAPPAASTDDDSLPYDTQIAEYEQMMEAAQAQADTTSQQFESLESVKQPSSNLAATGKASRDSDDNSSPDSQTTIKQSDGWIPCSERMPEEGGRYWCYVEEINSLGKSHYQWNCSWDGEDWGGEGFYGRATHWQPLPEPPCK
ncbi:DUF551 domain-containing protein [Cronobacter sakazakii]